MWTLKPQNDGEEVKVLQVKHLGFTQAIPGHPALLQESSDAVITLADLPVKIRYSFENIGLMANTTSMAKTLLSHHTQPRKRGVCRIKNLPPSTARQWGVDGAAQCFYELAKDVAGDATSEMAILLLKGIYALNVVVNFDRRAFSLTQWALFESSFLSQISWGESKNVPNLEKRFWPKSPFLLPGVLGDLTEECTELTEHIAMEAFSTPGLEHLAENYQNLRRRLRVCIVDHRIPSYRISTKARESLIRFLTRGILNQPIVEHLEQQIERVKTAHDLRGVAILFEHVIAQLLRWRQGLT